MPAYRDDLEALEARHQTLAHEVAHKTRELGDVSSLLEEARARARLPVLDNLRVASPCTVDWDQMTGDARVRACGQCNKQVFNLSELTREEAEALIVEKAGRLCARYYQRADGTILLKDCEVGVARRRQRRFLAAGVAAALAGGGATVARHVADRDLGLRDAELRLSPGSTDLVLSPPPSPPKRPRLASSPQDPREAWIQGQVELLVEP